MQVYRGLDIMPHPPRTTSSERAYEYVVGHGLAEIVSEGPEATFSPDYPVDLDVDDFLVSKDKLAELVAVRRDEPPSPSRTKPDRPR